ncbi:MAG: bile acid:sodium symporter [Xanthomonadales bacterium]|nr:bile acid:sodium symporter [Xanthomonadales bacterium]
MNDRDGGVRALKALLDPTLVALVATVTLATVLPVRGSWAEAFRALTAVGIAVLFFLYGARLSRDAVVAGLVHWRLHLVVLATTFVLFPLLGLALSPLLAPHFAPELWLGVLFLCALPSTVQSSVAFTAIARGNVAAAVCGAALSNLLGVFLTPLLASALLATHSLTASPLDAVGKIALQLFLPFVAGHLLQPWIGAAIARRRRLLAVTDRGTVMLVVYVAFSAAVSGGLWTRVAPGTLVALAMLAVVLLGVALGVLHLAATRLGFDRADRVAMLFCGSNKSLASGVPIANVLFAGNAALGMILLPIMLYHPLQLVVCALLAQRQVRSAQ